MKKISIIIACYNDDQYIERAVNSALNQSYKNVEVIVIDDGSNYVTKKKLEVIEPKISKLITQDNKGQSCARNIGIKNATGEFVLILDSDDYIDYTLCEKAVCYLINDNIKIVSYYANLLGKSKKSIASIYKPVGGDINNFLFSNSALGTSMYRKIDLLEIGGYDEQMKSGWEDWEMHIRLLKNGGKAYIIKESLYNYFRKDFSTTTRANKNRKSLFKYIYLKHDDLYKQNFQQIIDVLLNRIDHLEQNNNYILNSYSYKLGNFLLSPLIFFKSIFKKQ